MADYSTLTDTELMAAYTGIGDEMTRRRKVVDAQAEAQRIAAEYAAAVKNEAPLSTVPQGGIGPGRKVTEGGKIFVNTSGAWLPVMPSTYPIGYQLATPPDPAGVPAWKAGETVKTKDQRSYGGKVYAAVQGHTTQAGWEPPNVPAIWTLV